MEELKRIPIYKYNRSGKLSGILRKPGRKGCTILDMTPELRAIKEVRFVNYIKRDTLTPTDYTIEITVNPVSDFSSSYRLIRVLTDEDLDENRWKNTELLTDLPIGSHPYISKEEMLWAGKREGNIGWGIALALIAFFSSFWLFSSIMSKSNYILPAIATSLLSYNLIIYKWRQAKEASPDKLNAIKSYKKNLRETAKSIKMQAKTDFERKLDNYSYWERLSPRDFEFAIAVAMKKDGYELQVTKYAGDGGIDLEGVNQHGVSVIVQAKKYSSNVGVAVVREMIGVRESHEEKPLTIIVSLIGFTKGAIQLARKEGIILQSIKKDILKV
jgi:restriction system protein